MRDTPTRLMSRGVSRWLTLASDLGLIAAIWFVSFVGPDVSPATGLDLGLSVAVAVGILIRHRWPALALLVCAAADLVASLAGLQGFGYHFAAWVAVYTFSSRVPLPWAVAGTLPTMGAVFLAETAEKDWRWLAFGTTLVAGGTLVALAFGQVVRVREQLVVSMREQAEASARNRESAALARIADSRLQTAREVHDIVAHRMAVIHLRAAVSLRTDSDMSTGGRLALQEIDDAARAALADIDQLLADLRAEDSRGAVGGAFDLSDLVREFRDYGLDVVLNADGDPAAVATPVASVIRASALEALTNGLKHGDGAPVRLSLQVSHDAVDLEARNTWSGAVAGEVRSGWGLRGVRERAEQAGGSAWYGEEQGDFLLRVSVPSGAAS